MDLSRRPTTPDQLRIEEALEGLLTPGSRVLHVGVGNSSLAQRFHARVAAIDGVTLSEDEHRHAESLGLENYRTRLLNKYSPEIAGMPGGYRFIVDNNPSSFACCMSHFQVMLDAYVRLSVPGALLLTDREGMRWCYANGPMGLEYEDLETIAGVYPLRARRLTDHVFALEREAAP